MLEDALEVEAAPETRRERKKRATRLALKAAALDLIAARGYANVTVEDIADAADVSVRTFFNYFASKEAAIIGEDPDLVPAMAAELIALPADLAPLEALRAVLFDRIRTVGEDIHLSGEDHAVWLRRFSVVRSQPEVLFAYTKHLTVMEKALTNAMVERLGGDERLRLYAALVTSSAIGAIRVAHVTWGGEPGPASLLDLATAAYDLLAAGLVLKPSLGNGSGLASGTNGATAPGVTGHGVTGPAAGTHVAVPVAAGTERS